MDVAKSKIVPVQGYENLSPHIVLDPNPNAHWGGQTDPCPLQYIQTENLYLL